MSDSPATVHTLRLLNALAEHVEPQPAAALARQLEIPRTTTYRVLTTLVEFGYVTHDAQQGRYSLGPAAYELAWGYQRQEPLRRIGLPVVDRLVDDTGHSAHLALLNGKDVLYVIEQRGVHCPSLITEVGVRLPAEVTASGRAMLSLLSETQVAALYPGSRVLTSRTGNTPRTMTEFRAILRQTRERGWAEEIDAVTVGWSTVAVAVVDRSGYPVAALASTFETAKREPRYVENLLQHLRRAAAAISFRVDSRCNVTV